MSKKWVLVALVLCVIAIPMVNAACCNDASKCYGNEFLAKSYNSYGSCLACSCIHPYGSGIVDICNKRGGIVCQDIGCIYSGNSNSHPDCTVTVSQEVNISQGNIFFFNDFNVLSSIKLRFYSQQDSSISQLDGVSLSTAGTGGLGGDDNGCSNNGHWGGAGGTGGQTARKGANGALSNDGYNGMAFASGKVGADVTIVAIHSMTVNGVINVSGGQGAQGVDASGDYSCGYAAEGGAGGNGGGILKIYTPKLLGSGTFVANGGNGGEGGYPTDDSGDLEHCGGAQGDDCGGGSGGGGGGGAGQIILNVDTNSATISSQCNGGIGGKHTCSCNGGNDGNDGSNGQSTTSCVITKNAGFTEIQDPVTGSSSNLYPENCNDNYDNDNNGATDFQDLACINSCSAVKGWEQNARILSGSWYSSSNGSDGCCGDDISNAICSSTVSCNSMSGWNSYCSSAYGCGSVSSSTTSYYYNQADYQAGYDSCTADSSCYGAGSQGICENYNANYPYCAYYMDDQDTCESGCQGTFHYSQLTCNCNKCQGSGISCRSIPLSTCQNIAGCSVINTVSDFGYISGSGTSAPYLCYDRLKPTLRFSGVYSWLPAGKIAYTITTINKTDAISNGQDWYYCNADGKNSLNGLSIAEGSTFKPRFSDGMFSCAEMLTALGTYGTFDKSCDYSADPTGSAPLSSCCEVDRADGSERKARVLADCLDYCKLVKNFGDSLYLIDDTQRFSLPKTTTTTSIESSDIDIDSCIDDPGSCLVSTLNTGLSCAAQPFTGYHSLCDNATNICSGGSWVSTTESSGTPANMRCCYGAEAKCIPTETLQTAKNCSDAGGIAYDKTSARFCSKNSLSLGGTQNCCFGVLLNNLTISSSISNSSFICFKENGQNIISQCCFDSSCVNANYSTGGYLSSFSNRLASRGSAIHTIENFDSVDKKGSTAITNKGRKVVVNRGNVNQYQDISPRAYNLVEKISLDNFDYLEFDVLSNSDRIELYMNGNVDIGNISRYSTNGYRSGVWHHIVVPLNSYPTIHNFTYLRVAEPPTSDNQYYEKTLIIDNIYASTSDNTYNTQNYYCTGGSEGWVDNLDAPFGSISYTVTSPHMFACSGIASFGWTGSQCCGDDANRPGDSTHIYGEYFADTTAGCFDSSRVINNKRVSDVKGVIETANSVNDQLRSYKYADLLYFNDSFMGCQVPSGKYSTLRVSYEGASQGGALVNSFVNTQCAVRGDYYCDNNVWRSQYWNGTNSVKIKADEIQNIQIKYAPVGANMIKNGFYIKE